VIVVIYRVGVEINYFLLYFMGKLSENPHKKKGNNSPVDPSSDDPY
jgi:hypothetical protein